MDFLSTTLTLLIVIAGPQAEKDRLVREDLKALQGAWIVMSVTNDGKEFPPPSELKKLHLHMVIEGDKYKTKAGDVAQALGEGRWEIDPTTTPKSINQVSTAANDKGRTSYGIYKYAGDELRMCFAPEGASKDKRPTEFESKTGTKVQLMILKRDKK
jgi:uncharacterized protein (TIGR03067 family)